MIIKVTSKDGVTLYTRANAKSTSRESTRRQLQAVADTRTVNELLVDEYYLDPDWIPEPVPFTLGDYEASRAGRAA